MYSDEFSIIVFQCIPTEREHSKYTLLDKTVRKIKSIFFMAQTSNKHAGENKFELKLSLKATLWMPENL